MKTSNTPFEVKNASAHLIDMSAVFFRYYFAQGLERINDEGWDVSALYGSARWLLSQTALFEAKFVVAAFDESLYTGFRHQIDEDYKANRAPPTEDIIYQFECLKHICECLGFTVLASEVFEADDLIAAATQQLSPNACLIHSRDKDLRQLLGPSVMMKDIMTDKEWCADLLLHEEGIHPEQVPLLLALMGDASDNIVGVPRVGIKTATTLIRNFSDWPTIYSAAEQGLPLLVRGEKAIRELLLEFSELIPHNLSLTRLRRDADIMPIAPRSEVQWDELAVFHQIVGLAGLSKLVAKRQGNGEF